MKVQECGRWLTLFFDSEAKYFGPEETDINVLRSCITLPYNETWRVRIAWMNDETVQVTVSHCPTGKVTLDQNYPKWEDAVVEIGDAVNNRLVA